MDRFCLKVAKYNSTATINRLLRHCTRRHMPVNANPALSHLNKITGSSEIDFFPIQRKKGIGAFEVYIGVSRSWYQREGKSTFESFLSDARVHFLDEFGGPAVLDSEHYDETTPHAHFTYSPFVLGCSATSLIGGPKYRLNQLQTDFQIEVGKKYGLKRMPNSVATRAQIDEFYAYFDKQYGGPDWKAIREDDLYRLKLLHSIATSDQLRIIEEQIFAESLIDQYDFEDPFAIEEIESFRNY